MKIAHVSYDPFTRNIRVLKEVDHTHFRGKPIKAYNVDYDNYTHMVVSITKTHKKNEIHQYLIPYGGIKYRRMIAGITQSQMAEYLRVSRNTYRAWECNPEKIPVRIYDAIESILSTREQEG